MDAVTGAPAVPNGSIGDRWGEEGKGRWNLELGDIEPELSLLGTHDELVDAAPAALRHAPTATARSCCAACRPSASAARSSRRSSTSSARTTASSATPTCRATGRRTPSTPRPTRRRGRSRSPASTPTCAARIAREFARNAERTNGRSMIVMGAGTNHWFHSDLIYRSMLNLVLLCGCQGVNGGGWAHYVGQEKVRTITGFSTIAFALDWNRPPRQQAATPFWYLATDQWRYDAMAGDDHSSPVGDGVLGKRHVADCNALAARLGWTPSYPTFDRNPLDLADAAKREGATVSDYVVDELKAGRLRFACEDPDAPDNFPRVLTIWRSNLLGSSSKGHEYFLKHLLGIPTNTVTAHETPPEHRPKEVRWRDEAPEGKLDLLVTLDFRMAGTALHSDVVLPAATWYEKHDISTTDLHPFVHSVQPGDHAAVGDRDRLGHLQPHRGLVLAHGRDPPRHAHGRRRGAAAARQPRRARPAVRRGARLAQGRVRSDPRPHDAQAHRRRARLQPRPQQDARARAARREARPGLEGHHVRRRREEVRELGARNGLSRFGVTEGRPLLDRADQVCEAILALSGTTNGRLAVQGFETLEKRTGTQAARPRREPRGRADHVRRRRRPAAQDDHVARVVGDRAPRPPLLAVHDERRALDPVAHADRPPAPLRRPRLDARPRRGHGALPAAGEPPPLAASPARPASRCATSRRTRSGRSTRPTRTTCRC